MQTPNFVTLAIILMVLRVKVNAYVDVGIESMQQTFGDVDNFVDWTKLKSRKINKTLKMVGTAIFHTDIDNSYLAETAVFQKQGGEYRLMPYKLPKKGVCDFIASDEFFLDELAKNSNFSDPIQCPMLKGTYSVFGYVPKYNVAFNMIQSGHYALQLAFEKNQEKLMVFRFFVSVIKV